MKKVICEKRNRIAYVTLNRPEALNALDEELNDELWEVWSDFNNDADLDVAILTGAGKAFCAGADLKTFIPKWEHANMLDARRNAARGIGGGLTRRQHRITKPVIGAINGHALGGGFELALRSAKETVLDIIGRPLDDALRLETINGYSSVRDFSGVRQRLAQFNSRGK